ncbi:hypothetical protein C8A00DRAFT_38412 [Chaetomidium leptoderma]|uniref:Uncharacterized protein n=1 Tax=Chaetomidium leptoderma TaxID=669021 RepID=A0AAN6VDD6_9PEZI|nr:hypothetical protein C8A00DRAFT_38412 [Chaetomidium leptoderma]
MDENLRASSSASAAWRPNRRRVPQPPGRRRPDLAPHDSGREETVEPEESDESEEEEAREDEDPHIQAPNNDAPDDDPAPVLPQVRVAPVPREETLNPAIHYPPYVLLLGSVPFLLYLALYLVDFVVLYLTVVPGAGIKMLKLALKEPDLFVAPLPAQPPPGVWTQLASIALSLVGSQVAGSTHRSINLLLMWSFALDIAAFGSAVLFIVFLWCQSWRLPSQPPRIVQSWWSLFGGYIYPWSTLIFLAIWRACTTPPEELLYGPILATTLMPLTSTWVFWLFVMNLSPFLATQIPCSCYWQLAVSRYRLDSLDPYQHQIHPIVGWMQFLLLLDMLGLLGRTTEYCRQCITYYVDQTIHARYPEIVANRRAVLPVQ